MKYGCAVIAAATLIAGLGFVPEAVEAACNVRNPTACTKDAQPQAEAPQPQVQTPQPQTQAAAAKPLQLKRYIKLGPARRSVSRSGKHRTAHRSARRKFSARNKRKTARASYKAQPKVSATASAEAGAAPLTPKVIPTIPISARALALASTSKDHTVGFAAETTPWSGEGAFASANEAEALPPGVTIARFDEINEIDRAADVAQTSGPVAKSDSLAGASLMTPASATTSTQSAAPKQQTSWLSWLYEKAVNGVFATALAIRSLFA
jgi:hypothetical protein